MKRFDLKPILDDIRVELTEEFKENFRRKGFFENNTWKHAKTGNSSRTLLKSGNLMRSIQGEVQGNSVVFTSSMPYASIHNEGGEITITQKMKNFFWAKHLELKKVNSTEAGYFKAMALKKVGDKMTIPKRQFIGNHAQVRNLIENIITEHLNDYFTNLIK